MSLNISSVLISFLPRLSFFVALMTISSAHAQLNPKSGFIVANGDTIIGTVDFLSRGKSAKTCIFRKDGDEDFKTYSPGDITAYSLMDNTVRFVSKTLPIEGTPQTFFAECLLKGCVSLYRYEQDNMAAVFFLEDETGKVAVIEGYEDMENMDPKDADRKKRTLLLPAMEMLVNSLQARNRLCKEDLTAKSMVSIIREYNKQYCTDSESSVSFEYNSRNSSASQAHFVIEGGLFFTSYDLASDLQPKGTTYKFGAGGEWFFPRINDHISLQVMASYHRYSKDLLYQDPYEGLIKKELRDESITLLTGINYFFLPKKPVTPFINGGISLPFCFSEMGRIAATNQEKDDSEKRIPLNVCLHAGAGMDFRVFNHHLRLSARYELPIWRGYAKIMNASTFVGMSFVF